MGQSSKAKNTNIMVANSKLMSKNVNFTDCKRLTQVIRIMYGAMSSQSLPIMSYVLSIILCL